MLSQGGLEPGALRSGAIESAGAGVDPEQPGQPHERDVVADLTRQ